MARSQSLFFWFITLLAATCGTAQAQAGSVRARAVTPDGATISDAVVTVAPMNAAVVPAKSGTKAVMIQEGKQFIPFVLAVQAGTTVDFPNHDSFRHQVYSFSTAKTFELKLYDSSEVGTVVFDKPGVVPLGCNIHDNMLAYVYVALGPHFATTGETGQVELKNLPAGNYDVAIWHPQQRGETTLQTIAVSADGAADVTFEVRLKNARGQRKPGAFDERAY